jgi:tellurite methyltransferase
MSRADADRWNARYRAGEAQGAAPSPFLLSLEPLLPRAGRALDVAGGAGRNALWLAARGLTVTLVDIAEEGLALARAAAAGRGLPLETLCADLEEAPLPDGPFDLVVCTLFLHRPLFAQIPPRLRPGGLFVFQQPTRSNLQRHPQPPARFLLEDGELPALVTGLELVRHDEVWFSDAGEPARHEARLVARRPAADWRIEEK